MSGDYTGTAGGCSVDVYSDANCGDIVQTIPLFNPGDFENVNYASFLADCDW